MQIEFDPTDIDKISNKVAESIKPLLKHNGKSKIEDTIYDVKGLAHYLRVDESWIYKQVSLKAIPYFKCGKYTRFKKSAIETWVDGETVKPVPPL